MKYIAWTFGIVVFISACSIAGYYLARQEIKTDLINSVEAIKGRMELSSKKVEDIDKKVNSDVRKVRALVSSKVVLLDDDAVAVGLNELTGRWRMEKSDSGVSGDRNIDYRNDTGRQGLVGRSGDLVSGR